MTVDRIASLRSDFARLGRLLGEETDGSKAAALARERRMIAQVIEAVETPEVSIVDQLADRRRARSGNPRAAADGSESG